MEAYSAKTAVTDNAVELMPLPASHRRARILENPLSGLPVLHYNAATTTNLEVTPPGSEAASIVTVEPTQTTPKKTKEQEIQARLHFFALCWAFTLVGWNDGSAGPLIPAMQRDYNVGFTKVSLIFVVNCIGFLLGAVSNVWLIDRFGLGKVLVLGAASQTITYAIQSPAPPFPVFVMSYLFSGFGIALQDAGGNGFVGGLPTNVETKLGFLHAFYGLGAFASPLVATHFSNTQHWSFHYLTSAGMALLNVMILTLVFRFRREEEIYVSSGDNRVSADAADNSSKYGQIIKTKAVHLLAAFAFLYVGIEVTLGGWIVTFIIEERHGGKDAGYISSGFFGGLALGRIILLWLNKKIGERRVVYLYSVLIIALQITIWFVPSLIQNAIAISFVGVLLGPMFPIIVSQAKALLPRWLLNGCIGWISAIGMAGSAALPFFTGILAGKFGIRSLQPLVVSMMSVMVGVWILVPKSRRVE